MPTYQYECDKCHRVFEVQQRISAPALTTCDVCGGAVRRLLSPAPFILRGDGWYVTDYPSQARKKAVEAEKSASSSTDKAATSTSETKKGDSGPTGSATSSPGASSSKPASSD
jgi:putative FmdB family regulatory protein